MCYNERIDTLHKQLDRFVDKLFRDKDGNIVIWQTPNWEIIAWAFFTLLAAFVHPHGFKVAFGIIAFIALTIWALREIIQGASLFRRILGAAILLFSILTRLR